MTSRNRFTRFVGTTPRQRAASVVLIALMVSLVMFHAQQRFRLVMQYDYSVDFRLALVDYDRKAVGKGEYFSFHFLAVPGDPRYGRTFVKRLVCVPGDSLRNVGRDFYCNGQYVGRAKEISREGKKLPLFEYDGKVPEGRLFAVGEAPASYDSKIWGFVREEWVVGAVYKIV